MGQLDVSILSSKQGQKSFFDMTKKNNKIVPGIIETSSNNNSPSLFKRQLINTSNGRNLYETQSNVDQRNCVEIFIKCKDLVSVDVFSKSDPFVVLYIKRYSQWWEYGRTETIANSHNPSFVESFLIDASNHENQQIKFSVYDSDNMSSRDLQKCKVLGSTTEINITDLKNETFMEFALKQEGAKSAKAGYVCVCSISLESNQQSKKQVRLSIGANKLAKKNFFNRSDVFLEVSREIFEDTYHPVYRSEVIFKSNSPRWKFFTINEQKLCNGNHKNNILFQVWDYSTKGQQDLKGELITNLNNILSYRGIVKELPLKKQGKKRSSFRKKEKERELNVGQLKLYHASTDNQYSLMDFIVSGMQIKCAIGIDFTMSNGFPLDGERSLHCLSNKTDNDYVTALKQVAVWMFHYCKKIKLFGFGGKLDVAKRIQKQRTSVVYMEEKLKELAEDICNEDTRVGGNANNDDNNNNEYSFEINKNNSDLDQLISNYRDIIPQTEPSGPTYFKPIINKLTSESLETENEFQFGLIVTDGVSNDEVELEEYLLQLKDKPVIIIIVGVGPCLFTPTIYLVNRVNHKAKRKMFFFYRIKDMTEGTIREMYASFSKAVVDFHVNRNIHPKKTADVTQSMLDIKTNEMIRPSSPSAYDIKRCCPTCGSYVNMSAIS